MLQLTDIRKSYQTADFSQTALDGVSIAFRDNEFAAVLGPSGSGKTTMLNIIGGLDHYDSGDLAIDGISTRRYKDRDWDTYRNNRIGFVFQSYNLIPHQTVLSNVELALTLSGVSKAERRRRARLALEEVGLGDHVNKRPNQLSGGQMQRVAIARALINDPEILLADEPTGALDTQTGNQVMDLLTGIAKDRLVVMVTHNSDLAEQYANRTIHLTDGKVTSDSRPFNPADEPQRAGRGARKAKMSFFTAIALSFSNLMTKKGRTFVTSLAGSIGIIGIAAILALANGINEYIQNVERETMSIYPLSIQQAGFDLTSMFADAAPGAREEREPDKAGNAHVINMIETMFSLQSQNDLASLKTYIDTNESTLAPYVHAVQYRYDITPQIYLADTSGGAQQVNPDAILTNYGLGANSGMGSIAGSFGFAAMNAFYEMPEDRGMFEYQYDMVAGRWPENYDETVLVLSQSGGVSDYVLYGMGLRDRSQLAAMIESVMDNTQAEVRAGEEEDGQLSYDTLMSARFRVVNPAGRYQYDERYGVWVDKSGDSAYMRRLVNGGLPLGVVGIVQPKPDETTTTLSPGINYTPGLITWLMEQAVDTKIVRDQLSRPAVNVLTGKTFAQENEETADSAFSFYDLITIDEDVVTDAFQFDTSQLRLDLSGLSGFSMDMAGFDLSGFDMSGIALPPLDLTGLDLSAALSGVPPPDVDLAALTQALATAVDVPAETVNAVMAQVLAGFLAETDLTNPDLDIAAALNEYLARADVQAMITAQLAGTVDPTVLQEQVTAALQTYMEEAMQVYAAQVGEAMRASLQTAMQAYMGQAMGALQTQLAGQIQTVVATQLMPQIQSQIERTMNAAMAQLPQQIQNAITIDQDVFAKAFQVNMDDEEILELMTAMMNPQESTYERNLTKLGYADAGEPSGIDIYPLDFSSKEEIEHFFDEYNDKMETAGEEDKVVRYTDIVGAMMTSVTDIVNMISSALIAFVAISLVVSSIMIGVITYISVLERKKEIGILRAMGASKRDVRRVFNAETLIIGFVAGVLGVVVTLLLCIPANMIIASRFDVEQIAQLPLAAAVILIVISMFLAFIAGLFPSSAAARRDPVEALRSE